MYCAVGTSIGPQNHFKTISSNSGKWTFHFDLFYLFILGISWIYNDALHQTIAIWPKGEWATRKGKICLLILLIASLSFGSVNSKYFQFLHFLHKRWNMTEAQNVIIHDSFTAKLWPRAKRERDLQYFATTILVSNYAAMKRKNHCTLHTIHQRSNWRFRKRWTAQQQAVGGSIQGFPPFEKNVTKIIIYLGNSWKIRRIGKQRK